MRFEKQAHASELGRLRVVTCALLAVSGCKQAPGPITNEKSAQTRPSRAVPPLNVTSTFLSGAWKTDSAHPRSAISAGLVGKGDTLIRIGSSYWVDDAALSHRIETDRGIAPQPLEESSSALVEGRDIELIQTGSGLMGQGYWSAVTQPVSESGFAEFQFAVRPQSFTQVLDLASDRQFVLTFAGYPNTSCPVGELKLFVNGKALTYRDKTSVVLTNGNSVWSYGKTVHVQLPTACKIPQGTSGGVPYVQHYSGSIKVMNAAVAP